MLVHITRNFNYFDTDFEFIHLIAGFIWLNFSDTQLNTGMKRLGQVIHPDCGDDVVVAENRDGWS